METMQFQPLPSVWNFQDLTGSVFHRLTVIGFAGSPRASWYCRCECGATCKVLADGLKKGATKSCGCLRKEVSRKRQLRHGESSDNRTAEYRAWYAIKDRTQNVTNEAYPRYGGRGITMCDRWSNSYEAFLEDMGRKPSGRHSIERQDNNKGYEPGNCVWDTPKAQNNNRRSNRTLSIDGVVKTVAQWADISGAAIYQTILTRLALGWTHKDAVFKPTRKKGFVK